jgi:hypothetical protein
MVEAADGPAKQAAGGDDRQHHAQEQRPVPDEGEHDVAGHGARHQAAHDGLRRQHRHSRRPDAAAVAGERDAGDHGAHQQGGGQADQLQHSRQHRRPRDKEAPLPGRRQAGERAERRR